jgi:hypothetical protein
MRLPLAAVLISGIALGGAAFAQDKPKADKPKAEKSKAEKKKSDGVTVRLREQNKSGESGTARLTPAGDKTKVEISLKGAPKGVSQPAHIHDGTCAKLDPKPKYGLENVVDGKSTTEVPVALNKLLGEKVAINVHKSAQEAKVYVACGNITKGGGEKKSTEKKMDKK